MEIVLALVTILDALRTSVEFAADVRGRRIDVRLSISVINSDRRAILAFGRVTNEAEAPVTVSEVALLLGDVRASRVPLLTLRTINESGDLMEATSYRHRALFRDSEGDDLRILDPDLYLQPGESRTGWMMFPIERRADADLDPSSAAVEICVGHDRYIRRPVTGYEPPAKV